MYLFHFKRREKNGFVSPIFRLSGSITQLPERLHIESKRVTKISLLCPNVLIKCWSCFLPCTFNHVTFLEPSVANGGVPCRNPSHAHHVSIPEVWNRVSVHKIILLEEWTELTGLLFEWHSATLSFRFPCRRADFSVFRLSYGFGGVGNFSFFNSTSVESYASINAAKWKSSHSFWYLFRKEPTARLRPLACRRPRRTMPRWGFCFLILFSWMWYRSRDNVAP